MINGKRQLINLLCISLVFFAGISTSYARGLDNNDIPDKVLSTFQEVYPDVKDVTWSIRSGDYRGEFTENQTEMYLYINPEGQIKKKAANIEPGDLPDQFIKELKEKYPGFRIEKARKIEEKNSSYFEAFLYSNDQELEVTSKDDNSMDKIKTGKDNRYEPEVYGYIQSRFRLPFETGNDGLVDNSDFRVQRVRIGVKGDINQHVDYEVDIDPRAPEITGILRDAFIGIKVLPDQKILFGQQKTIFGYENMISSSKLYVVNRSEVSDNLSRGVNLRDIGIGVVGGIPLSNNWSIEDGINVTNGAGMNVQDDDTPRKNVWGRIGLKNTKQNSWLGFGVSGAIGDMMDEGDSETDPADDYKLTFYRAGIDSEYENKWFMLNGEFVYGIDSFKNPNGIDGNGIPEKETENILGYYITAVGKTAWNIGPILRFDSFSDEYLRWTFGAYYGESDESFRILINYELRLKMEQASGKMGRGDDKLYIWSQVKF